MRKPMRRANGDGSIIKLGGRRRKPYAVRITTGWTEEGKQQYKYLGYYANRTDAKNALNEYNVNPYDLAAAAVTFKDLALLYLKERENKVADSTLKIYKQSLNKCAPVHDLKFTTLRKMQYQEILNDCTNSVGSKIKSFLNNLYNYAIDNDIIKNNYARSLEVAAENTITIDRHIFTDEEINALWANINAPFADLVLIMLYSGVRIGEILTIETKNIDLENKIIVGGIKTDAGKNRRIPIHDKIFPLVAARVNDGYKYLYVNRNGVKHDVDKFRERHFTKLMRMLNIKHTPHDTRHTFVTKLTNAGTDERMINLIIGHSNNSLAFDTYTHITNQQLLETVNQIK